MTYDDGPGTSTRALLEVLAARGAAVTFFMVGSQVEHDPDLARAVLAAGHQIGSHSMRHLDHHAVDAGAAIADMLDGAKAIAQVLGVEPTLYRAPYGHFTPETVAEARTRGWTCVHWSALGEDWLEGVTGRSIAEQVLPGLEPGAIVLLHDSRREKPRDPDPVVDATDLLLREIERRGLRSRPVGDILP